MPEKDTEESLAERGLVVWNCLIAKRLRRRHARCIETAAREGYRLPAITVRETGDPRGRGVFALRDFEKGECVEVCPVIPMTKNHDRLPSELQHRVFNWQSLSGGPEPCAIALGYGSLYNHANPATLRYLADAPKRCILFLAVRRIRTGEELTINYNGAMGGHRSLQNNWFEANGIQPL